MPGAWSPCSSTACVTAQPRRNAVPHLRSFPWLGRLGPTGRGGPSRPVPVGSGPGGLRVGAGRIGIGADGEFQERSWTRDLESRPARRAFSSLPSRQAMANSRNSVTRIRGWPDRPGARTRRSRRGPPARPTHRSQRTIRSTSQQSGEGPGSDRTPASRWDGTARPITPAHGPSLRNTRPCQAAAPQGGHPGAGPAPRPRAIRGAEAKVRIGSAGSSLPISRAKAPAPARDPGRRRGKRPSGASRDGGLARALSDFRWCPTAERPICWIFSINWKSNASNKLQHQMPRRLRQGLDKTGDSLYN
jgi:hypothetical protein